MQDTFERMISGMTDDELACLSGVIYRARRTRTDHNVKIPGFYPVVSQEEKDLLAKGERILAIKTYKDRTNLDLMVAAEMIYFWGNK